MPADKYEEVLRRLAEAGAGAPPGRIHHFSYGSRDNLQVVDVYDSPESMQAFGQTLVPILQDMGIHARPEVQEVYKTIDGQ
jgi:hypothetical protein